MSKSKVVVITGVTSDSGRSMDYRLANLEYAVTGSGDLRSSLGAATTAMLGQTN